MSRTAVGLPRAELIDRIKRARELLRSCTLCERKCAVDRTRGEHAPCGLDDRTFCFKRHVSFAEELELLPSYMVYFAGCNFRCRFCVQGPDCFDPARGVEVRAPEACTDFRSLVDRGARTINLLGGEPSLHLHTILEIALENQDRGAEPLPLLLNTNMYMTPEVIDLLDGVIGFYVADFKFGNDGCAKRIAGIERYVEVVTRNLLLARGRADLIVRHLLMPGHTDCCLRPCAEWLAANLPGVRFTLMTGYVPAWRAAGDGELGKSVSTEERAFADALIQELGLTGSE